MVHKSKKLLIVLLSIFGLTMPAVSGAYTVPSDFREVQRGRAVYLYTDYKGNYVLAADLSKGASLEHFFGEKNNSGEYKRFRVDNLAFKRKTKAFAFVNGAFFNFGKLDIGRSKSEDFRRISFPATPGLTTWGSTGENTKTLCIKNGNKAVMDKTGTAQRNYSYACNFSFTALDPSVDKKSTEQIRRTYIGVSKDFSKVLFFVSTKKTQKEMESIMIRWKIPNYHIIMGDGSESSALLTTKYIVGGGRSLPHMIVINDK